MYTSVRHFRASEKKALEPLCISFVSITYLYCTSVYFFHVHYTAFNLNYNNCASVCCYCSNVIPPQGYFKFILSHMNYSDKNVEVMLGTGESDLKAGDGTCTIMAANKAGNHISVFR